MATLDRNNLFQTQLFEKNVLIPYLQDYRNVTNFARFMGGSDAVIYNKMEKTLYITLTYVGFLAVYGSFMYDLFKIKNR